MLLTHEPSCLLYFDDESDAALRLAEAAGLAPSAIERHRLPDGELKLRLPPTLPGRVVLLLLLLRTLAQPNEKLVELLLAAQTARALGARHLALVAP
jgi:ribose-phosphate pyrophosphokinase